ncbi:protein Asterix [Anabrus simplex]|uniref:protein Asterix n=1 Tax=Anabrus simplex TaxID=316456 RepID=UPI0035A3D28C
MHWDGILSSFSVNMHGSGGSSSDPRRPDKEHRFKVPTPTSQAGPGEDLTPDFMNILGMIFSMCGLMMRLKWCAWVALYCSCISFANSRVNDDTKQILSSFMLSISAVVMSYLQNPQPMSPPWASVLQ